jgi:hypothetical protein
VKDARPGRARSFLIGLQVSASTLLLISAAVFLSGAFTAAAYDPGMRTTDTIAIQITNEPKRTAIVQAVTAEPAVAAVAASGPDLAGRAVFAETTGARAKVAYKFVSPESFGVLDIELVRGRAFTPVERMPTLPLAIVSETTARALWPNADPIGQVVRLDRDPASEPRAGAPPLDSRTFTVIGVARDVAGFRIMPFNKAAVYAPTSAAIPDTSLIVRVHGDPELARQTLLNRLALIDPDMARQAMTLRTLARMDTFLLKTGFWSTVVLGGLALALTLSGLFSVLSYLVEQRTREIGVRMALGATPRDVTRLVVSQLIVPVGGGLVIGGGATAGLAALLLASPAAAGIGDLVDVLDPAAYAASLLIIVAACLAAASIPATRASHLNPALTFRQE